MSDSAVYFPVPRIIVNSETLAFEPGATITGEVCWAGTANKILLRLFWFTSGDGDRDTHVEHELSFQDSPGRKGSFSFKLPEAPYSFCGKNVSLTWGLELLVDEQVVHEAIVLAPKGEEIHLNKLKSMSNASPTD